MLQEWSPDPRILQKIQEFARQNPDDRVMVNGKILTWNDVIEHVHQGTQLGRRYYRAVVSLGHSAS